MNLNGKRLFVYFLIMQIAVAAGAQQAFDEFIAFKTQLYILSDTEEMQLKIKNIKEYQTKIADDPSLGEEEKITLSNFLAIELINYMGNSGDSEKEKYLLISNQNNKSSYYMKDKKISAVSPWFLISWADIKGRLVAYLFGSSLYEESNKSKELYQYALKKDKKCSQGHLSFGLWLYFAPPIAGGGYNNALYELSKAVSYAKNNNEKFLSLCFRSQLYFTLGQQEKAEKDLTAAHILFPSESFTEFIRGVNKNGKVFFQ